MLMNWLRLRWLLPTPLSYPGHYFLIFVGWQHAHQSHHTYYRARPARRQPIRLRLGDGLVHHHCHVLRIAGDSSSLRFVHRHRAVLVTALWRRGWRVAGVRLGALRRLLLPNHVGELPFAVDRRAEAAPETRREVSGQRVTIPDDTHALLHSLAGLRAKSRCRHGADHRDHLVHHVVRQVAVQHPVARVDGVEFDVARLRHAH